MTTSILKNSYLKKLSTWKGFEISEMEDFDMICDSQIDFIEILLLGENEFSINLLENDMSKEDFSSVRDFLSWAFTNVDLKPANKDEFNSYHTFSPVSNAHYSALGGLVA